MDVPKDQISTLLDHGLYTSAQFLACFLVSSSTVNAETSPHVKAENLVLLADALFREREFRRAIVKFKIASCHYSLNENRAALVEMEGIPNKARNLQMNLMMGKLYRNSRHTRSSIACYKECLRHCPYVIEAIMALAELGVASKDIISLFPQTPNRSGRPPFDHFDSSRWLHDAVLCFINTFDHLFFLCSVMLRPSVALFQMITKKITSSCLKGFKLCEPEVRSIDPYIVTYMDEYAMLLKIKSEHSKLHKLVHDLLNTDPTRPEAFVALSVLWERKDERGALSYAEKSIRIDERHIPGYIMKGNLFLSMNQPQAAVVAFRGAQELRPDLRSYQETEEPGVIRNSCLLPGLVHSYLALSKIKEALHAAREAMKAMPQSAKALKLVGDVHASNSGGREKAKKFYESALRLEPGYLGAASALAELHVIEGRNGDAVSLLERYLKDWADDSLHIKLAQVFAATNMLQDALSHYQAALRINPQNEAAKKGLERLEKQMKGVDPDAPEEDEENEVEDADGDQIETELL
ncbi:hypothetical protein TEA_017012 [Camellia sinensis var. sinensis]|uniref:Uncharacterized protein n=1 Tax=Camellia sinensis var. sinensis TaxID=542762 RepID=A0A4S4F5C3_CAMSN|nr:hypothetical protein TEA_017012 [Camellia sinensis var. sinensis]